ncbi:MAG: acetolactate decarboxylase [Propionibacteriaceae bacterium]|uniref:Alpha-acetolactate decarboxylase n=1 Tax=Propionibacterium ruminifibrarum TaxID=1962131 RepID=A0A375I1P1_9ACTN|nr:acetolactate decarboxylase [Propionibacterium ruminifibrarum]MBE6476548.1 acetolactate decarboxylase [Propionibacteriaceae bacterium]SPF67065.1 Acetolactate decarboxylase [Propionibacterium ruminifibrarum]
MSSGQDLRHHVVRHEVFQTSLMSALLDGVYEGEMTLAELLGHGNFGIGTFQGLDGEMIIIDSVPWRMRADGGVSRARLEDRTPFATVTNFVPNVSREINGATTRAQLHEIIDQLMISTNYLYALRITGEFEWVSTRTVRRQERPYRPMAEATAGEAVVRHERTGGVMVGFRTPLFEQGINVAGCHVHFVDDSRSRGGHVMDFVLDRGLVEVCLGTDLHVALPLTEEFADADLAPDDLDAQVRATETHE